MDTAAKNIRNGQNKVSCYHGHCCQEHQEWTEQGDLLSWTLNANARKNQKRQDEERKKIGRTTWNVIIILLGNSHLLNSS
jgi:hypothetical protein